MAQQWDQLSADSRARLDRISQGQKRAVPWAMAPAGSFLTYQTTPKADSELRAEVLMEVEDDGEATGRYRWALNGREPVAVTVNGAEIVPAAGTEDYALIFSFKPEEIPLTINATSSAWEDLGDLVSRGRVTVMKGEEDASHEFLGNERGSRMRAVKRRF
jgi:hypothetical protein